MSSTSDHAHRVGADGAASTISPLADNGMWAQRESAGSHMAEIEVTRRWVSPMRVLILMSADAVVLTGVVALAYLLWAAPVRHQPVAPYLRLAPLLVVFLFEYARAGLYPGFGLGAVETFRRLSLRTTFVFLIIAAGTFALKVPHLYSRMTFLLALSGSLLVLPLSRMALFSLMKRVSWWGERAVVIGSHSWARRAILGLESSGVLGYKPCWMLELETSDVEEFEGLPVLGGLELVQGLADRGVRIALLAVDGDERWSRVIRYLQAHFRHLILIRGGSEVPVEGVSVRNLGGVLGIEFRNQLLLRRNRTLKRSLDLTLGAVGLVVSLPIIALAGAAVRLVSRGPILYWQEREGLEGRKIRVSKLRTMYVHADRRLEAYLAENRDAREEWEECFKLTHDPRIVPVVGWFLRRWSLDELPQFWSVVKGNMSLVGPRPFPDYHLNKFDPQFRAFRRVVRPGLTGLWQVTTRSEGGIEDQETLDSYYIRNWSIWLDIYILGRTLGAIISGRGAY